MSNRIEATQRGLGTVNTVFSHHLEALEQNGIDPTAFRDLDNCLRACLNDDHYKFAGLSLIAAYFNVRFEQTGRLFSVRDSGDITYDFVPGDQDRKNMASLLSD